MTILITPRSVTCALLMLLVGMACDASAQQSSDDSVKTAQPGEAERRAKILKSQEFKDAVEFIRNYATISLIHSEEELQQLKEDVKRMSADDLEEFLRQVKRYHSVLDSKTYVEVHLWLKKFLSVQKIYDDKELEEFRKEVAEMSPAQLREFLLEVQLDRATTSRQWAAESRKREQRVNRALQQPAPSLPSTGSRANPQYGGGSPPAAMEYYRRPLRSRPTFRPIFRRYW